MQYVLIKMIKVFFEAILQNIASDVSCNVDHNTVPCCCLIIHNWMWSHGGDTRFEWV